MNEANEVRRALHGKFGLKDEAVKELMSFYHERKEQEELGRAVLSDTIDAGSFLARKLDVDTYAEVDEERVEEALQENEGYRGPVRKAMADDKPLSS